jgi:hypothetical protein
MVPLTQLLQKINSLKVRIVASINKLEDMRQILKEHVAIDIRYLTNYSSIQPDVMTLIVDGMLSLSMEVKENAKGNFYDLIESATYSNSESIVWTHTSIFESFWIQGKNS